MPPQMLDSQPSSTLKGPTRRGQEGREGIHITLGLPWDQVLCCSLRVCPLNFTEAGTVEFPILEMGELRHTGSHRKEWEEMRFASTNI